MKKVAIKGMTSGGEGGILTTVRQSSLTHRQGKDLISGPHSRSKSSALAAATPGNDSVIHSQAAAMQMLFAGPSN